MGRVILASYVDHNLSVRPFPSWNVAWQQMKEELLARDESEDML